jgi:hypothetical protein
MCLYVLFTCFSDLNLSSHFSSKYFSVNVFYFLETVKTLANVKFRRDILNFHGVIII